MRKGLQSESATEFCPDSVWGPDKNIMGRMATSEYLGTNAFVIELRISLSLAIIFVE